MKRPIQQIFLASLLATSLLNTPVAWGETQYEVIDDTYTVCETRQQYRQLLSWSLYGVGKKPASGCFKAPAGAKAVILECPEDDIILCRFRLSPNDGQAPFEAWASKVMLREIP